MLHPPLLVASGCVLDPSVLVAASTPDASVSGFPPASTDEPLASIGGFAPPSDAGPPELLPPLHAAMAIAESAGTTKTKDVVNRMRAIYVAPPSHLPATAEQTPPRASRSTAR
jgi:hypothetical protein